MSATNKETESHVTDQAGNAGHHDTGASEEMMQDSSDTVTVAESGSNTDVGADMVSLLEVTDDNSETLNSSQGLQYLHIFLLYVLFNLSPPQYMLVTDGRTDRIATAVPYVALRAVAR